MYHHNIDGPLQLHLKKENNLHRYNRGLSVTSHPVNSPTLMISTQMISHETLTKLVYSSKSTTSLLIPSVYIYPVLSPLLHIINSSLSTGFVPLSCKPGALKPLLKKHNLELSVINNYRLVTRLSF